MSQLEPIIAGPTPAPDTGELPDYVRQLAAAADYLPAEQLETLLRAWRAGAAAHAGQTRKSGEPYITHPVAAATVLAEQGVDIETLVAAILHDTIEDTPLTRDTIAAEFGQTVAELVEGVTKLDKLQFQDRQEAAAESFRKMMLAMARDLRVILIKLADRLGQWLGRHHDLDVLASRAKKKAIRRGEDWLKEIGRRQRKLRRRIFRTARRLHDKPLAQGTKSPTLIKVREQFGHSSAC